MSDSRGNRSTKTKSRGWMWAFLLLLALNIGLVVWLVYRLQPTPIDTTTETQQQTVVRNDGWSFELTSESNQVNELINVYLEEEMGDDFEQYTLTIDDNVLLEGALQVFGFSVDFSLAMEPFVMENGNLQLRAQSIQLASFELPLSLTMNILSQQLDLPDWVRINSEDAYVLVAFNEFELQNGASLSMERVNLEDDDITVTIFLPEEAVR
ncbi:YpmS family protein [Alkalibacterium sp. MB6]|uniref:YpmS family protein n=1 Tax=Alkalibacterium sp. MB6 TaxID=2081965 RepID=UPI00137B3FD0|nr:YpmS family protein [Alkalibacterium sp. MB6]